jgi:restriction system protein
MVRAGNDNELVEEFESRSLVAIGWEEVGDVSDVRSYKEMKARFNSTDEFPSKIAGASPRMRGR